MKNLHKRYFLHGDVKWGRFGGDDDGNKWRKAEYFNCGKKKKEIK